jgi:hypothetical protein
MTRFERLEASRLARSGPDFTAPVPGAQPVPEHRATGFRRTDFAVGKLHDDGRFEAHRTNLGREVAESLAGRLRDESTDGQVKAQLAEGWTWGYRALGGNLPAVRKAFVPGARDTAEQRTKRAQNASRKRWAR